MEQQQLATMDLGYFANCLDMVPAGNLLDQPCNVVTDQQYYYYEPSTADYLLASPLQNSNQVVYATANTINAANHFDLAVSCNSQIDYSQPPVYAATFQSSNSIENYGVPLLESSVFLSPQSSAASSAAQSPQQPEPQNEILDLPLDDIFNINVDEILNNEELITNELLDVLNDVGCSDFLSQLEFSNQPLESESVSSSSSSSYCASDSSVSSTPKRKYSTDSSDCYSLDSFETCSNNGKKAKRARRPKASPTEKAARKKDQNKKAASRYRDKKKSEMQCHSGLLDELESQRDGLSEQLKKLQTEFNVILPLAQAAFSFDPIRKQHLSQLISRVNAIL